MPLDEAEFAAFYEQTRRPLWAYVYRVSGNAADADEIVAEAFYRLLRVSDNDMHEDRLRAYVFRIASNLLTDRWRQSLRERLTNPMPQPPPPVDEGALDAVSRTFAKLKERDRALLWLAYVEGQSHEQLAASLGVKRGSVKVLLSRARAHLRDLIRATGLMRG